MNAWDGLEIMARWPVALAMSGLPKIGAWESMQEIILKISKFIAVPTAGKPLPLSTVDLIKNHTGDWKCLKELLEAEVEYNNGFFPVEMISNFFAGACRIALAKISETLTASSEPLSPTSKPSSVN